MRALSTLSQADLIACEDKRVTQKLLSLYGLEKPLISYHDHNGARMRPQLLEKIKERRVALVSDAGMPLISDPGYKLVRACQLEGLPITIIPGANAALSGLCVSGISTTHFLFAGFPPPKSSGLSSFFESHLKTTASLIFYVGKEKVISTLSQALAVLGNRKAALCRELTKKFEEVLTGSLEEILNICTTTPRKGEFVLIIEGYQPDESTSLTEDVQADIQKLRPLYRDKDITQIISTLHNLPKKTIYNYLIQHNESPA